MNVLFVSLSSIESNNSAMLGNISIVKGLVKNGCEVTFLVAKAQKKSVFYDQYRFSYKNVNIVEFGSDNAYRLVEKSKSDKKAIKLLLRIFKSYSLFGSSRVLLKYAKEINLNERHFDIVISASDPKATHLFTKKLLENISYTRWVQLWGDPLLLDITNKSKVPYAYKKYVEYSLLKSCDKIIYVSPLTLEEQKKLYKTLSHKMVFFPIPYDEAIIYPENNNAKKIVGYFGNYNTIARDITPLYDTVKKNNSINLIIAGDSELNLESTNNIKILPRISRERVKELEGKCDILVCLANKKGTQIPAKINYYSSTNKGILFILDGESDKLKEYLNKYNRFVFCENNEVDILEKIQNFALNNKEPVNELSSQYVTKQIIEYLTKG